MSTRNLVIVESPAKAKTIEKYLGKEFDVVASYGHVRDLPKKGMSIDIEHNFEPTYEISPDKKKVVSELKKLAKGAKTVWLASDEDREGEAIAWHLCEALGLKPDATKRIVFHEITEPAIKRAVANPRTVDKRLVDAQQARRVLDRLVGYELSPILWRKVKPGLSAGRVQSVAVRLIVEREREIEAHEGEASFKVTAEFELANGNMLKAELSERFETEEEARKFLESVASSEFSVHDLTKKPAKRNPAPPFTTSTLQQEAHRKLGFSVKQTMVLAQRLYEHGHITYMRTDSVHLSDTALTSLAAYITKQYGREYTKTRQFSTKTAGAQEAHEAIRPTQAGAEAAGEDANQKRLYELIRKRAVASQMTEAALEKTTLTISISGVEQTLVATGEEIKFDGFLKVYTESRDEEDEETAGIMPPLEVGQKLSLAIMRATQTYQRPKPRYNEASLVKKLEEIGIGRPSTYAPTISTIQDREYVVKGDLQGEEREITTLELASGKVEVRVEQQAFGADRNKLIPTAIGALVTDFLVKHFSKVVDYDFTARAEDELDDIADGKKPWNKMIAEFYAPFHKTVKEAENVSRSEAAGTREIGADPVSGKPVYVRMGRYGPMVQLGSTEDDAKPHFAPLPADQKMEDVKLAEALELLRLPRIIGKTAEGEEIFANFGPYGPYVKFGSQYVSIKPDDPFSIKLERALELIKEKKKQDADKYITVFTEEGIKVANGRFGPYVTDGKKNAKIPKDKDPKKLTLEDCQELLKSAKARKKRKRLPKPTI
ncbi:MAG TPA: type I DNA topoisomerase [Candidatus Dormibacteraeota bacterium]|nr:type I DNA topoisomerase [Candidatus Dormibacteraeota bacterium]